MDITEFVKARLDEDEAAANAATPGPWVTVVRTFNGEGVITDESYPPGNGFVGSIPVMSEDESRSWANQEHIARHDPARALREVAAKRAILARYGEPLAGLGLGEQLQLSQEKQGLYFAVCALAAVYSDHPDYRAEWTP